MGPHDGWGWATDRVFPGAPPPSFLGRDDELARLRAAAESEGKAPATLLWGPAGVGKSLLARAYAEEGDFDLRWWVHATSRLEVVASLAELAEVLGVGSTDQERAARNALIRLGGRDRWLLVFDDADDPAVLAGLLPTLGGGQVIITSRHTGWGTLATPIQVGALTLRDAESYLRRRCADQDHKAAAAVAEDLDRLPLALALAAAYCRQTRTSLAAYHRMFRRERAKLQSDPDFAPRDYPVPVVVAWRACMRAAARRNKAAPELLELLAALAPVPVATELLTSAPHALPRRLQKAFSVPDGRDRAVAPLAAMSLLTTVPIGRLWIHRLVRDLAAALSPPSRLRTAARAAVASVLAAFPRDVSDPRNWPRCHALLPHARAALDQSNRHEVAGELDAELRERLAGYLSERGEYSHTRILLTQAATSRENELGRDHPRTLASILELARVEHQLGQYASARRRLEAVLPRCRRVLGVAHPATLAGAGRLADLMKELGDPQAAWRTYVEITERCRETYGRGHPSTLIAANNLAGVAEALGRPAAARRMYRSVFSLACESLGPAHPVTTTAAGNLALVLQEFGDLEGARGYLEHNLDTRRRHFGLRHPATVDAARKLAALVERLGETDRAEQLRSHVAAARVLAWQTDPDECVTWLVEAATGGCTPGEIEGALDALRRSSYGRKALAAAFAWIVDGHRDPRLANSLEPDEAAIVKETLRRLQPVSRAAPDGDAPTVPSA